MDEVRHDRARRQDLLAVDDDDALRHQSGAEGHHQRLNAEQSDADAVDHSHHQAQPEPDRDRRDSCRI